MKKSASIQIAPLVLCLLTANSVWSKDNSWWKEDVHSLNDSSQRLAREIKQLNSVVNDTLKLQKPLEDVEFIAGVRDPLVRLNLSIKALANTLNMAGFSLIEDRPQVVYQLQWQCGELHLDEPDLQQSISVIRQKKMPKYTQEITAAAKVHDEAAKSAESICKKLKL